jgi:hypothetical protein
MYDWSHFVPDASKNAAIAIRFDSQGSKAMAIEYYQRAIDDLLTIARLYPDYKLNKVNMERVGAYRNRIQVLMQNPDT